MSNNNPRKRLATEVSAIDDHTEKIVAATNGANNAFGTMQGTKEDDGSQTRMVYKQRKTDMALPPSKLLGRLAAGIHIGIAERCGDKDLCALRLVCRSLSKDTTDVFVKRFFSYVECDISSASTKSLARLQAISFKPEFCRYVKRFSFYMQRDLTTLSGDTLRVDTEVLHTLTRCFRSLSKANAAQSICISHKDDGGGFEVVSHALAASRHHITSLNIWAMCVATAGTMFLQSMSAQELDCLCSIWSKLITLEIGLLHNDKQMVYQHNAPLYRLLAMPTCLESLTVAGPDTFGTPSLHIVRDLLPGPPLRKLWLSNVDTTATGLVQFISAYRNTLEALELDDTILLSEAENAWSEVLEYLGAELALTSCAGWHISRLSADGTHRYWHCVHNPEWFVCGGTREEVSLQLKELATRGFELESYGTDSNTRDEGLSLEFHPSEEQAGWSDNEEGSDSNSEEETSDESDDEYQ